MDRLEQRFAQIYNLVRGISYPGPCARTILDGRTVAILKTKLVSGFIDYLGTCGQVIGRNQDGVLVKTGDNVLLIEEYCEVSATENTIRPGGRTWRLELFWVIELITRLMR